MGYRASYRKTTVLSLIGAALLLAAAAFSPVFLPPLSARVFGVLSGLAGTILLLVACGGLVCLWRDARDRAGKPDLLTAWAARTPQPSLLARLGLRAALGRAPRPGDLVRIKSLREIEATLDEERSLEGLPFMREMEAFCGHTFVVHRRIDKINDMRHKTGLRRMRRTVTLSAVRCPGTHHGGCQAECQILWKDAWLTRAPERRRLADPSPPADTPPTHRGDEDKATEYVCQMTRLWEASSAMARADIRQDLRPLLYGNIGPVAFVIVLLTRLFNCAQSLRGGTGYPFMPARPAGSTASATESSLSEHERVVVRSKEEIAHTLTHSRNKGLWFDRDMVRYCGQRGIVRRRIERVIHEATGRMVQFRSPCVTLDNVVATGEFLRLCPQHEYIFWREAWLRSRAATTTERAASA